ncbi:MAG TPA: hypothetical protein VM557_09110 [Thermoanaerobaculia bacterium]|nr:hypothetical protein [Thermoanaerobaculia bacterium]
MSVSAGGRIGYPLAASITFALTIGLSLWTAIAGLAIGGAPAAVVVKRAPVRPLLAGVGILIILLSARSIVKAIG